MNFKPLALCLAALLPALAAAQQAYSTKWINLRAGPARDYPLVMSLGPGTPLLVQGCTEGFGWCDVVAPGDTRGWVYAGNIAYPFQNADVPVLGYGAVIGFPIVTFVIGNYWNQYYRNRPWYGNQDRWSHHRPPPRPIIRPPGPPPRPGPIVRPPPRPYPPGVRPPGDHRPPPGAGGGGGGGRPPGGVGGGRPPGAGDGRPPGPGAGGPGGGRPPGGVRPPGRPDGGDRPDSGGRPGPR